MVKIAFWDNGLGERGTSVSLFNYAHFNETILGNQSIIMYNTTHYSNNENVINQFTDRFTVYGVDSWNKVDDILALEKCDILYITKAGENEGQFSKLYKTVVHVVFYCSDPHGDVYASISPWVDHNNGRFPVVPYIVDLPNNTDNMRSSFNIPEDAVVFGRHGGYGQFDIPFVHNIVYNVALSNPNIYFLFLNTKPFCDPLPNIIHLSTIVDLNQKVAFINTCDAMLWARSDGETFGLAIGEFSIKNKPVLYCKSGALSHVHLLQDKGILYNENNLQDILVNFNKEEMEKQDWNAYRDYTPEKVMQIFKKVFIE
jgi:hypothetical protein